MAFSLRRSASLLLREWEQSNAFAADLVEQSSSNLHLDPRDRAALQRLVYAVIRHQRLLDHVIASLVRDRPNALTRRLLRMGLAELLLLDGAPHAVVSETVTLAGRSKGLVNAVLRRAIREMDPIRASWPELPPEIRWSVPGFLWKRWCQQHGLENSVTLARWNLQPAHVYLRLHPPEDGMPNLEEARVAPVPGFPAYVRAEGPLPRQWLEAGWAYAQDPSTQSAVDRLQVFPGASVLDACAAPGGKTLAIVQAAPDTRILATDQSPERVAQLRDNLRRLRCDSRVEIIRQDWLAPEVPLPGSARFDRILLDVPCSNTGVIRRRIDVPWRLKPEDFAQLRATQFSLLERLSGCLAPGGRIVYSTCSLDREENEEVVERFLTAHPDFHLASQSSVKPWEDGFDGAFSAALERRAQ
ncbi:MAG: hypothetical protein KGS60_02940 [Verrucomicrobia bacterium]|nr:hypothetical protein [Verrucomicrobiota bacterium]